MFSGVEIVKALTVDRLREIVNAKKLNFQLPASIYSANRESSSLTFVTCIAWLCQFRYGKGLMNGINGFLLKLIVIGQTLSLTW